MYYKVFFSSFSKLKYFEFVYVLGCIHCSSFSSQAWCVQCLWSFHLTREEEQLCWWCKVCLFFCTTTLLLQTEHRGSKKYIQLSVFLNVVHKCISCYILRIIG